MGGLVRRINQHAGCGLVHLGDADVGETAGAAYVRWPDGRRSVVTQATVPVARMRQTAEVLHMAWSRGLPVPRHELIVEVDDGVVAVVQERLPGSQVQRVDAAVIDALVAVNDRFAGVLADRPDVPVPALTLPSGGPVDPRLELVDRYSDRSRRLLHRIGELGAASPAEMTGTDLVHPDFTVPNVLFDDAGRVTGVVDWNNGAARGDRHFALVKLLFDLTWDAASPAGGTPARPGRRDRPAPDAAAPHRRAWPAPPLLGALDPDDAQLDDPVRRPSGRRHPPRARRARTRLTPPAGPRSAGTPSTRTTPSRGPSPPRR